MAGEGPTYLGYGEPISCSRTSDHREGIASSEELFRWVLHSSNFDQNLAQLRRITLLLAMISRRRLCDVALSCVSSKALLGPPTFRGFDRLRAEGRWATFRPGTSTWKASV
jgi:hypothetical protein